MHINGVPLLNPKFASEVPQMSANFGFAALVPGLRGALRKRGHA
jgi:hypothetical protein